MLKVIVSLLSIGLLPITAVPAEAAVCTWKSRQYKDYTKQPYTKYAYKTSRTCSKKGSSY
jgi:hypothetical protein